MKIFIVSLVSFLIITGFFGCKKNSQVEEPALTGCAKHAVIVPKITLNGIDSAGKEMELSMDSTAADTGLTYFWQLPNGSVSKGRTYTINEIEKVNKGTHYGYYVTNDSCTSYKNPVTLKADGFSSIPLPCELPYNYLEFLPTGSTQKVNMKTGYAQINGLGEVKLSFYRSTPGPSADVNIDLNVKKLEEGVYKMHSTAPGFDEIGKKYAWLRINTGGIYTNYTGHSLYIVKNKGVFEVIVCGAPMSSSGPNGKTYPLDAHLVIE